MAYGYCTDARPYTQTGARETGAMGNRATARLMFGSTADARERVENLCAALGIAEPRVMLVPGYE